ncbi:MAG: VWA domain-containing protein [Promethearchaeota archaeon]
MISTSKEISMTDLLSILIEMTQSLRSHPEIKKASAGRGTLAFFEILRSLIVLNGRCLTKDDIKKAALVTLPHRIAVKSLRKPEEIVEEVIHQVLDKKKTSISIVPPSEVPLTQLSQTENNALLRELMKFVGQRNQNKQPSSALKPVLRQLHPDFPGYFTRQTHGFSLEDLAKLLQIPHSELEKQYPTLANFFRKLKQHYRSQTPSQELMRLLYTLPNQLERLGFIQGMNEHSWHPSAIFTFTPTVIDLIGKDTAEKLLGAAFKKLVLEDEWQKFNTNHSVTDQISRDLFRELLEAIQTLIDQRGMASPQSLLNESNIKSIIEERLRERLQVKLDLLRYDHLLAALDELQTLLEKLENEGYLKLKDKIKLTTKAYALLFEELVPEVEKIVSKSQAGHRSKKTQRKIGERKIDIRSYKSGDSYRDISIQRTIKNLVRQGKHLDELVRNDLQIYQKNPPTTMAIALALDISSSMGEFQKLYYARKACVGLTYAAQKKGDKVGIIAFSDQARVLTQLTLDVNLVLRKVFQQTPLGNTNIQEAILLSRHLLLNQGGLNGIHKHIIMLSDTVPTTYSVFHDSVADQVELDLPERKSYAYQAAVNQAKLCRRHDISLSIVCIRRGHHVDEDFARKLALDIGQGSLYFLENESSILKATLSDYMTIRNRYLAE